MNYVVWGKLFKCSEPQLPDPEQCKVTVRTNVTSESGCPVLTGSRGCLKFENMTLKGSGRGCELDNDQEANQILLMTRREETEGKHNEEA